MSTAKDLLLGRTMGMVYKISPDESVQKAIDLLTVHNIGALLVINEDGNVQGILSERDVVRKVGLKGKTSEETKVREIMTGKVYYVEADRSVEECMALMHEKNIRHLPVFEKGKLLGLISIRDVLKTVITDQQIFIAHLEQYIRGG